MRNDERSRKHAINVQNETSNPAILNDVIDNRIDQGQAHNETPTNNRSRSSIQKVAQNNMDGKTWAD